MKKFDDRLDHSGLGRRSRQRIVDVGGVGPMNPERVKCPFCSELILRDAIKCRFCGEWFSMPDEDLSVGHAISDNRYAVSEQQDDYTAVVDIERPIVPSDAGPHAGVAGHEPNEGRRGEQNRRANEVEESPPRVAKEVIPVEGLVTSLAVKRIRRGIPWLRALLLILYLGTVGSMVVMEFGARAILTFAAKVEDRDPNAAASKYDMYSRVVGKFPLSFAVVESWARLGPICESSGRDMPKPSWFTRFEGLFGKVVSPKDVLLLPLLAWPVSALLLCLVFLTRMSRPALMILAILLTIVAVAGAVIQFSSYGLIHLPSVTDPARELMQTPAVAYLAAYMVLAVAALMTLTSTGNRQISHIARMAPQRVGRR